MFSLWTRAEHFYATSLPIIFTVLLFLSIIYFIAVFYTKKKTNPRKIAHVSFLGLIALAALYGIWGHSTYNFWLEDNEHINPGIRTQRVVLGRELYEDGNMVNIHKRSSALAEKLDQLDLYESITVKRELPYTYIGSRSPSHFFAFGEENQYVFRIIGEINWTEGERELVGKHFQLKDDAFETIGFINDYGILFDSIFLPASEKKELDGYVNSHDLYPIIDLFPEWTFFND